MPQQLGAPGVYIEEIPSGRRVLRSVSTSVAAFIDFFREGPMNEPVRIFGTGDFDRVFGGQDTRSEASFAVPQFFLNGGTEAWVVRVAGGTPDPATATLADAGGGAMLTVTAASEGEWGDTLRVEIDHDVDDSDTNDLRFNMRVIRFASTAGNAQGLLSETFLNLSMDENSPRFVETIVNDGSRLVTAEATGDFDGTVRPAANGLTGAQIAPNQAALDAFSGQAIDLSINGGTATTATFANWAAGTVTTLNQLRARVEAAIRAANVGNPYFSGARVTLANGRLRVLLGRAGADYAPADLVTVTGGSAAAGLGLTGGTEAVAAQQFELAGGDDGTAPDAAALIGTNALEPPTGMFALDNVDLFNILCVPRAAELSDTERNAVYSQAIAYCERRRAMTIVDLPPSVDALTEMTDHLAALETAGLRSANAAIYYPRVRIPDPTDDFRLRAVGASGTIAGVWARTDTTRGVWKAPAGIEATLEGVSELDARLNDNQNGVINPVGVNALRTFPVYGTVCWGARTLVGADAIASEWAYVPVRRLALMLEESLFRGTKWVVFEPNDEPTWANIRLNIGAFMNGLFQQGAFQGRTPRDAYYVKCDNETTTQNDIDQGIVNIEVGFAPLKPAEFVVIRFRQIVGQVEV
jgi:phage tail sheath protein FI